MAAVEVAGGPLVVGCALAFWVPAALADYGLTLGADGRELVFDYDTKGERTGITALLKDMQAAGLTLRDVQTSQSSLEDIFVGLLAEDAA